jgi:hypothetical protein
VPADATSLTELKRVSSVDSVVVVSLLLHRVEQPTLLMGGAHSVNKVVKLSYYSKLLKLLELVTRSCSSKLLLLLAYSVTIYCCLDDKVDNMACAAQAVVGRNVYVWMEVQPVNELAVVRARVITHKAVELAGDFVVIEDVAYDSRLSSTSVVSIEIFERDQQILLFEFGIYREKVSHLA